MIRARRDRDPVRRVFFQPDRPDSGPVKNKGFFLKTVLKKPLTGLYLEKMIKYKFINDE
jgi:hypothetical protein